MSSSGMNYAPEVSADPVCEPGELRVGAVSLEHGHINGMCKGLETYGAEIAVVYDPDPEKTAAFEKAFPGVRVAASEQEILDDESIGLVASAGVPSERGDIGLRAIAAGKDYFSDKAPFTTRSALEAARAAVADSGKKWFVCYSERVQNEAAVYAGQLIDRGAIGRVIQVIGLGPHRLQAETRPEWFFRKEQYGGILIDIGSHQIEQFLFYAGASGAKVLHSKVGNYNNPDHPELEDFGDATLVADNGATNYFRVDWFTPDGLRTWGDGRTFILGTEGYIELRKYINVAAEDHGDHVFLVNAEGEQHFDVNGKVGFPYFGRLIRDVLDRSDTAMPQEHTFRAAELCIACQEVAERFGPSK
jgi:predicted dehydrogenase